MNRHLRSLRARTRAKVAAGFDETPIAAWCLIIGALALLASVRWL